LTIPASTARSTSTTFPDKLTFPDEPTSNSTRATSTSTFKREEEEKPRHSASGQEVQMVVGRDDESTFAYAFFANKDKT